jgi:3-hydroxybutyryl-CoA dehydrogenase
MLADIDDEAFAPSLAKCRPMNDLVLVAGGGAMGAGIAFVAAQGGYRVEVVEPDMGARDKARTRIARSAERAGDASIAGRVAFLDAIPDRSDAAVAIEAVPERIDIKRQVLAALASAIGPDALLATNTSSLSVAELASAVDGPERLAGLHFFNPPEAMKLLEIVHVEQTSDDSLERAYAFAERIGKTAVSAADTPGFIVNRVARPYYLQAMRALEGGAASVEELDALARAAGFRMGPFELMDFIGLDVNLATSESLYERTEEARFAPPVLQREMVAQGRLGRKSGSGFYDYSDGVPPRSDVVVPENDGTQNAEEAIVIVGFGGLADEVAERAEQRYTQVARVENDELLDQISLGATIVVDVGDGSSDRGEVVAELDGILGEETVFFVDAYATDLTACAQRMRHPERLVGYGVLASFDGQSAVEIVDSDDVSDEALALAQKFFGSLGKAVVLVEDAPALFLGRIVGSIVSEAVAAVHDDVATAEDVDVAMRLGTNYPIGPIAWGREIGGRRVARMLKRLARVEGEEFAPHRSLWVLDLDEEAAAGAAEADAARP